MSQAPRARTLRLLQVVGDSHWRGRQRQALALAQGLAARGHEPVLAVPAASALVERAGASGLRVVALGGEWLSRVRGLRRLAVAGGWDVVHLHDASALRSMRWAGAGLRWPACVLSLPDAAGSGASTVPRGARGGRVDLILVASEWHAAVLAREGIDEQRVAVVHTGIDLDRFRFDPDRLPRHRDEARSRLGLSPDVFLVGAVIHLGRESGLEVLIEAAARIRSGATAPGDDRIRLLLVGEGPLRHDLERATRARGLHEVTTFTGSREDVESLVTAMDVYTHPAIAGSGFPLAMREAMALGVPVVASDLSGIREIIDNGRHGLIAPPGDAAALALNIMRLRRDPSFAQSLGKTGSLKVQRYGIKAMVDRTEELYFRLIR